MVTKQSGKYYIDFLIDLGLIEDDRMVSKQSGKYYIYSRTGKRLEGPFATREEAEKRLRVIEYFAAQGKK